jgi:hypothetical protein
LQDQILQLLIRQRVEAFVNLPQVAIANFNSRADGCATGRAVAEALVEFCWGTIGTYEADF